jgi:CheY-like chemotaxis protein
MKKKKKILIVDDEEHVLLVLENRLSKAGYSVIKATNGKDAIALAKEELPELIISDLFMPDIDGADVVGMLEQDPKTKDIPVIFLTALLRKDEEKERKIVSGRYFLAKPYDPDQLLKEVAKRIK